MKKLLLTSFVLLAIGGTTMAQTKKAAKGKAPLSTRIVKHTTATTEAEKIKQAEAAKGATVNTTAPAAMTVQTEAARKKAIKAN